VSTPLIVSHTAGCTSRQTGHTDAAKRISDTVTLHWIAGGYDNVVGKWMAFRLSDGTSDNLLYPDKLSCMRHQKGVYQHYMYLCLQPGGMGICEAEVMVKLHRNARERDIATPDINAPHGGRDLIPRIGMQEVNQQIRKLGG